MKHIYLDCNASTPLDFSVYKVLIKALEEEIGNPSSTHYYGQQARGKLEKSREAIARFFQVRPQEIVFTSGGTEGAAMLLQGAMAANPTGHIISSSAEHSCVYQNLKNLERKGASISFLRTGEWGAIRPEDVHRAIRPDTCLITLMAANNETGVLTDIAAIAAIASAANIPFVVDGVAWLGKEIVSIPQGVSGMFFSGHKIYAPKGVGFCICRTSLKLTPLITGGPQEFNKRAGTENLSGILALAEAIKQIYSTGPLLIASMRALRDRLEKKVLSQIPDVLINGSGFRICNTTNLSFVGVDGEALLMALDMEGIAVSHGSACSSGALEPSRILLEMGIPLSRAQSAIRFSVGRTTTEEEIDVVVESLIKIVGRLRSSGY